MKFKKNSQMIFSHMPSASDGRISYLFSSWAWFVFVHMNISPAVIKTKFCSKGFCRLRPETHNELELIRVGDWGQRIISLFRLAVPPKHQRHAAQYYQIILTWKKPEASLFISRVWMWCTREDECCCWWADKYHKPSWCKQNQTPCETPSTWNTLSPLHIREGSWVCALSIPCQQHYFLQAIM